MLAQLALLVVLSLPRGSRGQDIDATDCSLHGPIYPNPANLTGTSSIQEAQTLFADYFKDFTSNKTAGVVNESISVGVFSTSSMDLLAEHHHMPSDLAAHFTGGKLDGDTIYRVGSVTKLLSTYTALAKIRSSFWSEPITNFVPELQHASTIEDVRNVNWSQVTLSQLVGHMGGLVRDYSLTDLSATLGGAVPGLPVLNDSEIITCGSIGQPACSREESLRLILEQRPATGVWQTPIYSNVAFQLLGMACENITGEAFPDLFAKGIAAPLGLHRTSWLPPKNDSNSVLFDIDGTDTYETDLGVLDPAGGAWSSINDLAQIGRSILQPSSVLDEEVRRRWLKEVVLTSNPTSAVGQTWEVFRMNIPVESGSNATRLVDLYTKNGGYKPYNAEILLSPDHNIGIVVLVATLTEPDAGPATLWSIAGKALDIWVPAAEAAARDFAKANLVGTFASKDGLNSSIILEVESDRKGVQIRQLVYNGTDFLSTMLPAFGYISGNLQYMDLQEDDGSEKQLAFRAIWQTPKSPGVSGLFSQDCLAYWAEVDTVKYGNAGFDEIIITVDENGRATSIEMPFLRSTFSRQ